ncbi:MAG: RNA methyltransferase [Bacteroidales bacterium]|nr:RNA methyltransferase [Bacteroidales bacterium]
MNQVFFMLSKNRIKFITSLRLSKFREQHRQFVAEGTKLVAELLRSDFSCEQLFATPDWLAENELLLKSAKPPIEPVSDREMNQISNLSTPPGVLAVAGLPEWTIDDASPADSLVLALDGISDPGNLGTMIRTADWFGISSVVCSHDTVDAYHPKVVQSTMGSVFRVKVIETDLADYLGRISQQQLPVYGALMHGKSIYEPGLNASRGVLVIGSESHGIRSSILTLISQALTIPRVNPVETAAPESLNASIATAIILSALTLRKA